MANHWAGINQRIRERHPALFAKAEALSSRMASAIALDTCHKPRLKRLRAGLRTTISCCDPQMLRTWIGEFEAAIDSECRAAYRTVSAPVCEAA